MGQPLEVPQLTVIDGKAPSLTNEQRAAVTLLTGVVRGLSSDQLLVLLRLIEEFRKDGCLENLRETDLPPLRILAEVLSGWVYEFARAWTSTLVAREDGFDWLTSGADEKEYHRDRIAEEMERRGVRLG
jgi:hypothetical protein